MNEEFKKWLVLHQELTTEELEDEDILSEVFVEMCDSFRSMEALVEWAWLEGARIEANACRTLVGMAPDHAEAACAMFARCRFYE